MTVDHALALCEKIVSLFKEAGGPYEHVGVGRLQGVIMLALGCKQFTIRMNKDGKVTQFCCWWRCHDSQVEVILKRFRLDDSRTPKNVCLGDSVIVVDSAQTAGSFIESRRRTLDKIGPYKRLAWYRRKDERDYYRIYGGHYGWR